jgi:hypothetical protein
MPRHHHQRLQHLAPVLVAAPRGDDDVARVVLDALGAARDRVVQANRAAEEDVDAHAWRRARVLTLAPLRNRHRVGDDTLVSRIAEGFTEFTWDGRTGYGMTEYIERIEDGVPVGYPL